MLKTLPGWILNTVQGIPRETPLGTLGQAWPKAWIEAQGKADVEFGVSEH